MMNLSFLSVKLACNFFERNLLMQANKKSKMTGRRFVVAVFVVGSISAVFAPNGFFTGHRQVILAPETSHQPAQPHLPGDKQPETATLNGRISSSGGLPIAGAMVTAFNQTETRRITAYSDAQGRYVLPLGFAGKIALRVRTPYFKDTTQTVTITDGAVLTRDFVTEKITDPDELSESLTASAHIAMAKWDKKKDRSTFISQCNFCHQIGNQITRVPRSKEDWKEVVDRMEGYLVLLTDKEKKVIATKLSETFKGVPVKAIQTWDVSPVLSKAIVEEWVAGDGLSFIHDAEIGRNGRFYGADEGHDIIWELDPKSNKIVEIKLPTVNLPVGGKFSGLALPIGVFTGSHGPHSLAETSDGRWWITNSLSSRLMAFKPESGEFKTYNIGADSLYLHTIRADRKDRLWFTIAASNQVGVFDPKTERLDLLDLPSNGLGRWLADAMLPTLSWFGTFFPRQNLAIHLSHHKWANLGRSVLNMPYGIDINPKDGSAWYVKLYANKIGRIDPVTLEIKEYDTPAVGPRRPRFASDGILWIPGFDTGELLRFNPETGEYKHYKLPKLAPNEYETPYALNVHPVTGIVWITSNMSDRIFSFNPKTETFISYPLPTRSSFLRDIVFTKDGKVCSSHSNLPSHSIEGGLGGFICLDPDKND